MKWKIKRFNELSLLELYKLLQLRNEVFIVEQNCVYQDIDGKDEKAIHVMGFHNDVLVAYARLFDINDYFENATSIGRVIVKESYRNKNFGHDLMIKVIEEIQIKYNQKRIIISAQFYLKNFYETHGFIQISEMYLEDNIPHIKMELNVV